MNEYNIIRVFWLLNITYSWQYFIMWTKATWSLERVLWWICCQRVGLKQQHEKVPRNSVLIITDGETERWVVGGAQEESGSLLVIRSSMRVFSFLRQVGPPVSCFAKHLGCSLNSARGKTLLRHVETNSTTERKSRCDSVAKTSPGLSAAISVTFWWITVKITATPDSSVTVTQPVTKQFALPA